MRILLVKLSALGDQIHLCPAVSDLRRALPAAEIHWAAQTEFAAVASMHQDVTKVYELPLKTLRSVPFSWSQWKNLFKTFREMRKNYYDLVIDAQGVLKSAVITRLVRRKTVIGISRPNQSEQGATLFYSKQVYPGTGLSAVTRLRELVSLAAGYRSVGDPNFRLIPPGFAERSIDFDRPVVLLPCASTLRKQWPLDCWLALINELKPKVKKFFLVWGNKAEQELVKEIAIRAGPPARPLDERSTLPVLANLLRASRMVIGVDSGVTHLANAVGTPTVMIFSSTRPELFFTPGSPLSVGLGSYQGAPDVTEVLVHCNRILQPHGS